MFLDRKYAIASALAAFIAWSVLADWASSLRWLPHAFVTGAITAAVGFGYLVLTTSKGIDYELPSCYHRGSIKPAFCAPDRWEEEKAALKEEEEYRRPTIFPDEAAFSKAVDGLLDLILQDYVTSWYGKITPRPLLQHEIDRNVRSVLLSVTARLMQQDLVELAVSRLLPIVTQHLKDFYDAERTVRGRDLANKVTESDELSIAIAGKYKNGKLHPVAALAISDLVSSSRAHMRNLVTKILPLVLPGNMLTSPTVSIVIREIVACAVLHPCVQLLTDPDMLNRIIVNAGSSTLQDRKSVRKMRAALDQHAPLPSKASPSHPFPRLRPYDSERQFERFIRSITHLSSLTEARRLRSELMSQLRRDSQTQGQDAAYLRRLETGRRLLDQRIFVLSSSPGITLPNVKQPSTTSEDPPARKQSATLREVIYDAAGLGYFMEYMDRQNLMTLVQFYLVVDGFRNPLEGDADDAPASVARDPDRMDIGQLYQQYLIRPEIHVPEGALDAIRKFLSEGPTAGADEYLAARKAVLRTQTQVYNFLNNKYFMPFKRSDLYYKWLAIGENLPASESQIEQRDRRALGSKRSMDLKVRTGSGPPSRAVSQVAEMRRPISSTSNLKDLSRSNDLFSDSPRRSMDESKPRPALFDDEVEDEKMSQSVPTLDNYDSDYEATHQNADEAQAISAMQLALDSIASDNQGNDSLFDVSSDVQTESLPVRPAVTSRSSSDGAKPNISSLGLVNTLSRRPDPTRDSSRDRRDVSPTFDRDDSEGVESDEDKVQEAAPGDLGLTEAIDSLNAEIERLNAQRKVLESLTAKAELTNNTAELHILRKSEQSLQREIKRKEMQKEQYVVQESDNGLYGQASVSIKSVMVGRESDGREFALYVIEVKRQAGSQMADVTWAVTRRYSQFHELHKRLRARFPSVRELDFPRKQTIFTLQKDFLQRRKSILERYLRSLLLVPAICRSRELRAFLSQSTIVADSVTDTQLDAKDFVSRIYNSVSDGMEEFVGSIPVLDHLSVAGQSLISAASAQASAPPIDSLDPATQDPATAAEAEQELNAYDVKEMEPFVKPICDIFLETFDLSRGNSWLRGRTVVVVLHQLLGGTIERRVRELAKIAMQDESLAQYVERLKALFWVDGKMRPSSEPRTATDKARTKQEAGLLLNLLIPDLAGSVVGKANAQAASRKVMAMLNNPRLNVHLVFTLLDEVVQIVFPEIVEKGI